MSTRTTETLERLGSIGNQVTLTTGATSALIGWWTTEHVMSLIGVIFAAISLLVTWHYKREAAKRLAAEAVRRAEIHALEVQKRRLGLEECNERIRLLRSGAWVPPAIDRELARVSTNLGKLEEDE